MARTFGTGQADAGRGRRQGGSTPTCVGRAFPWSPQQSRRRWVSLTLWAAGPRWCVDLPSISERPSRLSRSGPPRSSACWSALARRSHAQLDVAGGSAGSRHAPTPAVRRGRPGSWSGPERPGTRSWSSSIGAWCATSSRSAMRLARSPTGPLRCRRRPCVVTVTGSSNSSRTTTRSRTRCSGRCCGAGAHGTAQARAR